MTRRQSMTVQNLTIIAAMLLTSHFTSADGVQSRGGGVTGLAVADLRCEYLTDPLGIDTPNPRFSWKLVD